MADQPDPSVKDVRKLFRDRFGQPPVHVVRAPEALELLGCPMLDVQGLQLSLAANRFVSIAVAPRTDGKVFVGGAEENSASVFSISELHRAEPHQSPRMIQLLLRLLARRGVLLRGFSAVIHSEISWQEPAALAPPLVAAAALAIREIHPYTLTATGCTVPPAKNAQGILPAPTKAERLTLAHASRDVVGEALPALRGSLDSLVSLFGAEGQVLELDGQSLAVEFVPLVGDVAWVTCQSGLSDSSLSVWRLLGAEAVRLMRVASLRTMDVERLKPFNGKISIPVIECARYAVEERRRVLFGGRALRDGDFEQFGQYMTQSYDAWRTLPGDRTNHASINLLIELARVHPACLGARASSRGYTVNLVRRDQAESFMHAVNTVFEKRTGKISRTTIGPSRQWRGSYPSLKTIFSPFRVIPSIEFTDFKHPPGEPPGIRPDPPK